MGGRLLDGTAQGSDSFGASASSTIDMHAFPQSVILTEESVKMTDHDV